MANQKSLLQTRALDIQEDIACWLGMTAGKHFVAAHYLQMFRKMPNYNRWSDDDLVWALAPSLDGIFASEQSGVQSPTPTFCTSDYASMLTTMADSAPKNTMNISELRHPEGFIVFEKPLDIEVGHDLPAVKSVRAMSWYVINGLQKPGRLSLITRAWTEERRANATPRIPSQHKLFPGTMAATMIDENLNAEDHAFIRIIQAHFALLKSPVTAEEPAVRNPKTSPRTKRSLGDDLRRVYLRHPEYARYEADEAAAAREGRAPMRAHWVRGHWRNQHYSTVNENRWIWIDGYIKGNPENGTVSTRKVGVARANPSEARELVGAAL